MKILIQTLKITLKVILILALFLSFFVLDSMVFKERALADVRCGQITINWSESKNAEKYELYRDSVSVYVGKDNLFTDSDLVFGRSYKYKVRAMNKAGRSAFSNEVTIKSDTVCAPQEPSAFGVYPFSCGGKTFIFWNRTPEAERYELRRGRGVVYEGSLNYFFDSDLRTNRKYTYTVRAKNVGGWSKEVSATGYSSGICPPSTPEDISEEKEVSGTEGRAQLSIRSFPRDGVSVTRGRNVASFDIAVKHSDMTIKRVDLFFDKDPRRYLEEVKIQSGYRNSATLAIDRDTVLVMSRGDEYRVRFSNISFDIPEDRTGRLTVHVKAKDGVSDSGDISVYLKNGSIRMEDTLFIPHAIPARGGGANGDLMRVFNIR